ncbi:MAG: hypothetical protein PVF66_02205 [Candidatus Aminicenantes bacterium]|jgi:hypothetical protein
MKISFAGLLALIFVSPIILSFCKSATPTFGDDLAFLKKYTKAFILSDESGQKQVAVVPEYQARVMTSTADGEAGISFGWVNRELIASGQKQPHINVYGGEDRFWLGPEGGQYSIFFKKGDPFDLDHWQTPSWIDTEPYDVVSQSQDRAAFSCKFQLTNYSGTQLDLEVMREIRLLSDADVERELGLAIESAVKSVAFETVNVIKNTGSNPWEKETGLLSIWILGMFNASPATTVAIPFVEGDEKALGPIVNDTYFGKVPAERLVVKDNVMFFAADANYRSKIGVLPSRSKPVMGSYDAVNRVLTVVQFTLPKGVTDYVNSMWEIQEEPYGGDAVNSYNDGPPEPGASQLGRFYELETSSPALALQSGETGKHIHRTYHFQGSESDLDVIVQKTLGVSIEEIKSALKK